MKLFVALSVVCIALAGCNTIETPPSANAPVLKGKALAAFEKYSATQNMPDYKAFYYNKNTGKWGRSWGFYTIDGAMQEAKEYCEKQGAECKLYALGDEIVSGKTNAQIVAIADKYISKFDNDNNRKVLLTPSLTDVEIKEAVSGKILTGKSFGGQDFILRMYEEGRMAVRLLNIDTKTQTVDSGKWWVEKNTICRKLLFFFEGDTQCFSVKKDSAKLYLIDSHEKIVSSFSLSDLDEKPMKFGKKLKRKRIQNTIGYMAISGKSIGGKTKEFHLARPNKLLLYVRDNQDKVIKTDQGSWWIGNDELCYTRQKYNAGKAECFSVYKDAAELYLVDQFKQNRLAFKVTKNAHTELVTGSVRANAPKTLASDEWKKKYGKSVGRNVGYSELCSDFQGKNGDPVLRKSIKTYFKGNSDFDGGYGEFQRYQIADQVTGLHECDKANEFLKKVGTLINAAS